MTATATAPATATATAQAVAFGKLRTGARFRFVTAGNLWSKAARGWMRRETTGATYRMPPDYLVYPEPGPAPWIHLRAVLTPMEWRAGSHYGPKRPMTGHKLRRGDARKKTAWAAVWTGQGRLWLPVTFRGDRLTPPAGWAIVASFDGPGGMSATVQHEVGYFGAIPAPDALPSGERVTIWGDYGVAFRAAARLASPGEQWGEP